MDEDNNPNKTLNLANYILRGYGVESLYPEFKDFQYVNMGETYKTTLCHTGERFIISSWGDYVEIHERKPHRE